jgi:hypothetical protein
MCKFNVGDKVEAKRSLRSVSNPDNFYIYTGGVYTVTSINGDWLRVLDNEGNYVGGWNYRNFNPLFTMENE